MGKKKKVPIDLLPQKDALTALLRTHIDRFTQNQLGYSSKVMEISPEFFLPSVHGPLFRRVRLVPFERATLSSGKGRVVVDRPDHGFALFGEAYSWRTRDFNKVWEYLRFLENSFGLGTEDFGHLLMYDFQWKWVTFLIWLSGKAKPHFFWDGIDIGILKTRKALFLSVQLFHEFCKAGFCAVTTPPPMRCPSGATLSFEQPLLLGVLNVTPDSFSDGGKFLDPERAVARALKMAQEGAHALDLGAESTRPGSRGVSPKVQKQRLLPVVRRLRKLGALKRIPISIDTQSAEVARACLEEGADLINDISALRHDRKMAKVIARAKCPVILMHMKGTPRTMQKAPTYRDVMDELDLFFRKRIHAAYDAGIPPTKVLLDPGIGFGKTVEHNLEILRRLSEFKALGRPLVVGVSRKRFLGALTGEAVPERRVAASVAAGVMAVANGAAVLRVHDVAEHAKALQVAAAIRNQK